MQQYDIIIIGAGAAGLIAGRELARAGKSILLLEARNRIGGRIHTEPADDIAHEERGAEFIHGDLPLTKALLDEAGLAFHKAEGSWWQSRNGQLKESDEPIPDWDLLEEKLKSLEKDIPLEDFLDQHFDKEKYADLKDAVCRFATGYDTADPSNASTFALREEWLGEENAPQYRIDKGYGSLMQFLLSEYTGHGGHLQLSAPVTAIYWRARQVKVVAAGNQQYLSQQVIVTVPLNVLKAAAPETGAIRFDPGIPEYLDAIRKMGMGSVIKMMLHFDRPFWKADPSYGNKLQEMQFILSDEIIPTWWTQYPDESTVLTGWLGGPDARSRIRADEQELLQMALASLANIFHTPIDVLEKQLIRFAIVNWTTDPFTRGSYTYATVQSDAALGILQQPIAGTLFFAGEAFYRGPSTGTVEAALTSGQAVAKKLLDS